MFDIETKILELEAIIREMGMIPGTSLTRVLSDIKILDREGTEIPEDARLDEYGRARQSILVWCLGIGGFQERKQFFYGYTISTAIKSAEDFLRTINS